MSSFGTIPEQEYTEYTAFMFFWDLFSFGMNGISWLKITGTAFFFKLIVTGEIEPFWELTFCVFCYFCTGITHCRNYVDLNLPRFTPFWPLAETIKSEGRGLIRAEVGNFFLCLVRSPISLLRANAQWEIHGFTLAH